MTPTQDRLLRETFIEQFLAIAYANMEMENEVHEPFDKDKLYQRYKVIMDRLLEEGIYKQVTMKHVW